MHVTEEIGTHEAAEILHVSQRHVRRLVNTGAIHIIGTIGGRRPDYVLDAEVVREYAATKHAT